MWQLANEDDSHHNTDSGLSLEEFFKMVENVKDKTIFLIIRDCKDNMFSPLIITEP